jgi:hypothetical protein
VSTSPLVPPGAVIFFFFRPFFLTFPTHGVAADVAENLDLWPTPRKRLSSQSKLREEHTAPR